MKKSTISFFSNYLFFLLSLILLINSKTWGSEKTINKNQSVNKANAANVGDISVKKWANDKKSAFSFSFDDAYLSQYTNTRPILNQFGFNGTFYLLAGSVHDNIPEWRYGLWWQFLEMAQEGHEMAAHTMTHPHLMSMPVGDEQTPNTITYELYQSKKIIEQKIGENVISFAYPYTEHNTKVDNVTKKYFENGRAIGDIPNPLSLSGNAWYGLTSKQAEFNLPRNTPSDDLDELVNYETFTQNSINNGQWTIFQGHEVLPFSEISAASSQGSYLPISNEWLTALAQWIKDKSDNNDIWVETVGNITRYIKERDNFYYNVVSNSSNQIIIEVGDGLDVTIYNYPITTDIVVPNNWGNVAFTQGNVSKTLTPFTNNGVNYIRTKIIPGAGNVIVQNSATLFTITSSTGTNGSITPLGVTSITSGGSQTYTITPSTGYKIESITVDGNPETVTSESGQTYTFTNVTTNHTISATFSIIQFTITVSTSANGTISPSSLPLVNYGSNKSFTITPNTGYKIESITVDGNPETVTSESGQTHTFTNVTANHTISATFSIIQFTITVSTSANGTISPSSSPLVNYGSNKSFTITPNTGYKIESITVDGNPETVTTESGQTYTFANITANHSISASFSAVVTYYTFSGKVMYNNSANSPLANVTLKLTSSNSTVEASTNSAGEFQFNNLLPDTYQITLTTTNNWGGVNATDALRTVRYFANLDTFSELQKKAGDVNNDGSINSTDALLIARRFAGLISTFSIQDWVFDVPASIAITSQNKSINIKTLASGDVDGSLIP